MKKKVLHIITRYIKGGAEENTRLTCLGLKERYDIYIAAGKEYDKEEFEKLEKQGIKTKTISSMKHFNPFSAIFAVFELKSYIKKNNFDIVHTHSTEAGIIGRIAAKLSKTPVIMHTIHGTPFSETRPKILNWFVLRCEKLAANYSDKIIANADSLSKEYLKKGIGKKEQYKTIYSGIDIKKYEKAQSIESIRKRSKFNIALISRVTEGKGHNEAINALKELDDKDIHLFIVGDGDRYKEYKRKAGKNITFLGYRKDIENILASIDLLILPSYREGTPRSITESMAASLPIIATNIAGIPEQVKDEKNGFLIPIKDTKILKQKILYLYNNPEKAKKMGKESKKLVKKFSAEKMVEDIDMLYKSLSEKNH